MRREIPDAVTAVVKKILVVNPDGVTRDDLLKEYKDTAGQDLPYLKLGFNSLIAFVETVPGARYKYMHEYGKLHYVLSPVVQKAGPESVSKRIRGNKITKRCMTQSQRMWWGNRWLANRLRIMGLRRRANKQPLLPTPIGYDFSGSVQQSQQSLVFDRYTYRFSDSLVPMTERHLYDGNDINPTGYDRLDYVDRPSMKRRYSDDVDVCYDQFCSEYATSRKRIRLDAWHPVWCGPSTDPIFGYRQPRYVYTPRQHSDISTYKRLVREDLLQHINTQSQRMWWGNRWLANRLRIMGLRRRANKQPLLPTPIGYDFSGSVQQSQQSLVFDRYTYRFSDSLVPMTERHLYDGNDINPTGYDRLDYVDRPSMKRRYSDDVDVCYDQFCSEYATSRKRIRLDAWHPVWCGPSTDPIFGYRQPRYVYTPRQHSDISTYKRLVREDLLQHINTQSQRMWWGNRWLANRLRIMGLRRRANKQPLLPTPIGYDFSGSVQQSQQSLVFDRYTYRFSDSLVPMTERHLYDGNDINPTGYDRLDYVDRPSMKRRYSDDVDVCYDQFCSEYATSRKRIRLDAWHPVWCGPSTDPIFGYRQPRYVYTPRQHSDISTYKRLVREDLLQHINVGDKWVCQLFVTTMVCDKGDMCWFLHVPGHQLTMPDRDRFKLSRRQCCYYLATGCPWEDRCSRLHVSNHDITPEDRHRLRLPKMAFCRYHAAKKCIFGESCEWNHATKEVKGPVNGHVMGHVIRTSPEKILMNKFMDQFDLDCLEDVVRIEHFDTRV